MDESPKTPFSIMGPAVIFITFFFFILGGCFKATTRDGPPLKDIDINQIKNPVPHPLAKSQFGNPNFYVINGKRYHVLPTEKNYHKRGIASWYGIKFQGKLTSTHERYNMFEMTAASPELPIPCFVRVRNLENSRSVIVKVNDRGPFATHRLMDLSYAAAKKLGFEKHGTALVEITAIDTQPKIISKKINRTHYTHQSPQLYLQIATYQHLSNAMNAQLKLKKISPAPIVIQHAHAAYKLQIGPLKAITESDKLRRKMSKLGFNPIEIIR